MHEKMADSVEVGTSDECPSVQRLRRWLDGRAQLDASETTHVRQCEKCQSHLERFTSASDLDGSGGVKLDAKNDFAGEPALAEVQRDLATQPNTPNTLHETMEETPSQVDSQQQSHARTSVGAPNTSWLNEHFDPERYTLEGVIGRGGNADVFKIYDALLDRHFAIKTIASDHDRARLRMLREAKLLAEIDHVNILRVFDVGQVDDTDGQPAIYICMEYMAGGTLGDFFKVAPSGPADFLSLAGLLAGVCDGLALAHDKGIVHRDLKPANILLDEKGEIAKLADFGLATRDSDFQTMLTRTGAIVGTPAFMSPEQASASESIGPGSDVYAIGATLYFMLTRQVPFTGNPAAVARQIIDSDPVSPSVLNEKAPRELVAICERAMEKEPSKRYASSAELAQDFRAFVAGKQVSAKPISSLGKVSRQLRRDRKLYLAIQAAGWLAAALLILAVGSAIVFRRQSSQLAQAAERERADQQRLRKSLERSIEAADQLLVSVTEDLSLLPSSPGSDRISNTLLLRARDYYQKFLTENAGNDQLQFQLARAHSGLARISYRRGELKQGMQQTQNAKDLLAGIERSGESEQAVEVDLLMARLLLEQGTSQGKADPSDADADQALADCITLTSDLAERAEGSNQSDTSVDFGLEARSLLTSALRNRSVMLGRIGDDDLAGELAREAVAAGSKLVATDGASGRALLAFALANQTLGLYQMQHQEFQLGEATVEQALATLERIEEAERVALRTASVEANLHSNLARIAMMKGELDKATEEQQVAIEIHERMCAIEPDVPSHRSDLVDVLLNATNIEYAAERFERVIEVSQKAIDILSGLILLDEGNPEHLQTKAMLQGNIAIVQLHLGNPLLSIQPLTESLADLQRAAEQLNHAPSAQVAIALNHYSLAGAYYDLGQFDEALKSLDRSDKITADVLAEQPDFDQAIDHMIDSIFRRTDVLLEIQPVDTQQIIDCIAKADRLSDKLIAAAPDVIEYSARKLLMVTTRGEAKRIAGDLDAAIADADSILATAKELRPEDYEEMLTDVLQYTYLLRHDVLTDKLDATEGSDARGRLESERAKARKMAEQYGAPEEEFAIDER